MHEHLKKPEMLPELPPTAVFMQEAVIRRGVTRVLAQLFQPSRLLFPQGRDDRFRVVTLQVHLQQALKHLVIVAVWTSAHRGIVNLLDRR